MSSEKQAGSVGPLGLYLMDCLQVVQLTILRTSLILLVMRHRNMGLRPVHRIKHVFDTSGTLTAGSTLPIQLIEGVDAPILASTDQVESGSTVNGIYLHVEVTPNETDAGAIPNVYMSIQKNPGGNNPTIDPQSVGVNDGKRYVIHQEMVMLNNLAGGNPRTLFNGVIAIPRGYRRFAVNDLLLLVLRSTAVNIAFCAQAHYKEFR